MDLDEFDRYDYIMNDDERPRRKMSTQPGGCMLIMIGVVAVSAAVLFWLG